MKFRTLWMWSDWGTFVHLLDGGEQKVDVFLPPVQHSAILLPDGRYLELPRDGKASLDLELDWPDFWIDRTISVKALIRSSQTRVTGKIDDPWLEVVDPFPGSISVDVRASFIQLRVAPHDKVSEWDISALSALLALPRRLTAALKAAAERSLGLLDPVDLRRAAQVYTLAFLGQVPPQVVLTDLRNRPELAEVVEEASRAVLLKGGNEPCWLM